MCMTENFGRKQYQWIGHALVHKQIYFSYNCTGISLIENKPFHGHQRLRYSSRENDIGNFYLQLFGTKLEIFFAS
jgi:hypothetical protein